MGNAGSFLCALKAVTAVIGPTIGRTIGPLIGPPALTNGLCIRRGQTPSFDDEGVKAVFLEVSVCTFGP